MQIGWQFLLKIENLDLFVDSQIVQENKLRLERTTKYRKNLSLTFH